MLAFDLVTLDVPDPDRSAVFWCELMRLTVIEREDDGRWLCLADHAGTRRLGLQRGAVRSGGVHLDLVCSVAEFDAAVQWAIDCGALLAASVRVEPYGSIANLVDPDGYAFDVCAYR